MTRLSWNQYNIPGLNWCSFALCLTVSKQVGRETYLLFYFLSSESGYGLSVFISIQCGKNVPIDFCSSCPLTQDAGWICCSHFLGTSCPWVDLLMTQDADEFPVYSWHMQGLDLLFIHDTFSGWTFCQHRHSAWISCSLLLHIPVVGSPISAGDSMAVHSFLVHQRLDFWSAQDSAVILCSLEYTSAWHSCQLRHISCTLILGTSVGRTPVSTGLSVNFLFTISWHSSCGPPISTRTQYVFSVLFPLEHQVGGPSSSFRLRPSGTVGKRTTEDTPPLTTSLFWHWNLLLPFKIRIEASMSTWKESSRKWNAKHKALGDH